MAELPLTPPSDALEGRRGFLRRAGLGLGVVASAGFVQACDSNEVEVPGEGTLRGVVVDPDGDPVEGATVSIDGTSFTMMTGENGGYRFDDVPEGTYTVTVAAFDTLPGSTALGDGDTLPSVSAEVNIVRGGTGYTQNFDFADGLDAVTFDFSNDFGVLNYAYALEQLEAAFYAAVVGDAAFGSTFNADEQAVLQDLAAHEAIHRDFLAAALGSNAIPALTPKFTAIDFADRDDVLATAQTFEDLGVGAYNGAGQYLSDPNLLTIAGKIVSVEARHASVISGLISANSISGGVIDEDGLDQALSPGAVLAAADPFIYNMVSVSNLPA